jgi:hypothetical protein
MQPERWDFQAVLIDTQITVFLPELDHSYNHWESRHAHQGFSWRPGSVSFGTFDTNETVPVIVERREAYMPSSGDVIAIKVPFVVASNGIVLSDSLQTWPIPIPPGNYALFFTAQPFAQGWQYLITFVPTEKPVEAEIIRADGIRVRSDVKELLMDAEPI